MFNVKKTQLIQKESINTEKPKLTNAFIAKGMESAARTLSGNGSLKYSTTGSDFVDQFSMLGKYKEIRSYNDIAQDAEILYSQDKVLSIKFILYLRTITRKVQYKNPITLQLVLTEDVQKGAGLKHESIMRMIWLALNDKDSFYEYLPLFISVGCWHDVIQMLSYDLQYNGWEDRKLDWKFIGSVILSGLENPQTLDLLKKYLPQIKSNSNCKTIESQADNIIAKWICSLIFGGKSEDFSNYKKYRKLKASGTAHEWQQLISKSQFLKIDFDKIHGRALSQLVSSKFIDNNNLTDKYEKWISSKPIAKFTGYVNELFKQTNNLKKYQIDTINSQFMGLVEKGKTQDTLDSFIVVRDTSGSMSSPATGTHQSCYDIGKALALYFSYLLEGHFANSFIEFNSSAKMHTWKGNTPMEKWKNDNTNYVGGTDFLSVIRLFVQIKASGVSEKDFPTGIICISDSEFNPTGLNTTNVQAALNILSNGGFSKDYVDNFKIVLWNLQSGYYGDNTGCKFETYGGVKNVYYFSGYEGSVISFLLGGSTDKKAPSNAEELFHSAMDQEILNLISK